MKRSLLLLFIASFLSIQNVKCQNKDTKAVVAAAGFSLAAGIIYTAIEVELIKEYLEDEATVWVFQNIPLKTGDNFELKLLSFKAESFASLSSTRTLIFSFKLNNNAPKLLFWVNEFGWINEFGVDFTKLKVEVFTQERWSKSLMAYLPQVIEKENLKSVLNDQIEVTFQSSLDKESTGYISPRDISEIRGRLLVFKKGNVEGWVPLKKLKGDEHLIIKPENENFLLDYNERRLNIHLNGSKSIIQIGVGSIAEIQNALFF